MTAPKSLYSWDVVIKKFGAKLFIDKRDDPNILDNLTVNETSQDNQPQDEEASVNSVRSIMEEAVRVNNAFWYQQSQKDKKHSLGEADPFIEDPH